MPIACNFIVQMDELLREIFKNRKGFLVLLFFFPSFCIFLPLWSIGRLVIRQRDIGNLIKSGFVIIRRRRCPPGAQQAKGRAGNIGSGFF
jgi:hypothetical protein